MSGDPTQVVQFLAQNDVACPSCGYALRGCTQPCCPECGDEISLSLRGESTNVLLTALRYLVWAIAIRSILMTLWWIWASFRYSFNGSLGSAGSSWFIRMGTSALADVAIGVLCLIALRRLSTIKASGKYRAVAKLVAWIAILTLADVIIGLVVSASY